MADTEKFAMTSFRDMPYHRPDIAAFGEAMKKATEEMQRAESYAQARDIFLSLQEKECEVDTLFSLCSVRNTIDTGDAFYDSEIRALRAEYATLIPLEKAWKEALAGSKFREEFTREFGQQLLLQVDAELKTLDESIVEDTIRAGEISQAYQKDSAMAKTVFRGEECNFYGLLKHMESTDREERREAFHAWAALYAQISPQLDAQYDELVHLRDGMARKLGFTSFTDLAYLERGRFDYTQEDAAVFRRQILEHVTPFVAELRERQRQRLGLDLLCYYDEALIFPEGNADHEGDMETLVGKAQAMYREMSPETAEFFDFMVKYQLFDLESRPGKRMGGYMTRFPGYKAPFIFSNFNGTSADVDVLTHEAGHAFQGYLAMRSIPISALQGSTSEINEIHSMTMEHFAYPWMESFFGERSEQYKTAHLIGAISVIPYMACVDEFQHRMYEKIDLTPMERRSVWREIEKKYMPWRDYDGETFLEEGGFWMQKQHIFLYPFYYIDYALAQMCAFQYYGRMKTDRKAAWEDYLRLCRAGGTKGYFDLLEEGNLLNPFHEGTVKASIGHVIEELRQRY
ncbi:MAG: M3 family oligoendopeptidase [Clostridia bacterium]|nr:M3 family oligoendopeptidase [Clostridia bacterium]